MSAYLKRLQIDSVEESAEYPSAYLKRVEIVEVVDQDGNPWEPVPGPDPWDELVVAEKALLHESNICLLYTSPSPRGGLLSRMPSSA